MKVTHSQLEMSFGSIAWYINIKVRQSQLEMSSRTTKEVEVDNCHGQ